jgi:hypothetical protein
MYTFANGAIKGSTVRAKERLWEGVNLLGELLKTPTVETFKVLCVIRGLA